MILKQNTFSLVVETVSSSEISSASLSNPFRESGTSRNKIPKLRAARVFVFKMIDNLSRAIDFYWSINNVWHFGGSAMVAGLLLKGSWFSSRRFFSSLPLPLLRFLRSPACERAPQNPRWRSISFRDETPNSRLQAGYWKIYERLVQKTFLATHNFVLLKLKWSKNKALVKRSRK